LLALHHLGDPDAETLHAAAAAIRWILGVQNRDGGVPTFCRGWGTLPFDRSTPEITAHALHAWSAWLPRMIPSLQLEMQRGISRAIAFLRRTQRGDGSWLPLWFGNEHTADEENPTYGTARVVGGLAAATRVSEAPVADLSRRGVTWLADTQNADGGWGGAAGVRSSVEETGIVLSALASVALREQGGRISRALVRG
jgi:squalene-hopene/tetraprenyl-beta-curcumene cyclase